MQNFTGYNSFSQNVMYAPTPARAYGYNATTSKSPDLCAMQGDYSPINTNGMYSYGYQKVHTQLPVISMIACQRPIEDSIYEISEAELAQQPPKLKMKQKLSCRSKAFVKKDLRDRNDRKSSSDTKAQSEDEGNTSDDSNDSMEETLKINQPFLKKCATINTSYALNCSTALSTENAQTAFKVKFKTELCKNWQAGDCKFGPKCAFAHGFEEISEKRNLPNNYKTKICKQFHEEMYCSYGARCQFVHLENAEEINEDSISKAIYSTVGLNLSKRASKGRLSIFKNLSQ